MSAEPASPITTYFRVCDGMRVRYADTKAESDTTVLMLAPWPESLWAFRRIWDQVTPLGRIVALDMPGFGHSDQQRPELIAPDAAGEFLARLIDEWRLGAPHIVGPDVGTAVALFLAATAPERVTSLTIGGGAVRFPIEAGGALKQVIEAPGLDAIRALDARTNISAATEPVAPGGANPRSTRTTSARTTWDVLRSRPGSSGITRSRTRCWVTCCRRSSRPLRSSRGPMMISCHGRTTSISPTFS